jgi:hypothetical protein
MAPSSTLPLPLFDELRERLAPLVAAHGFRPGPVEYEAVNAFAEYWRTGLRLRVVWEGNEQAIWIDAAPEADAQIIGRWLDIEWAAAGERLPLNHDLTPDRVDRLLGAVERFLAARPRR